MNMATDAVAQDDLAGTGVEMLDKDKGLVNLDKDNGGAADDALTGDDVGSVDDARAAIYAKHQERRKEELGVQNASPDDEITVKVNGKERQVPRSKIDAAGGIEAYQKNAAASEILNQASAEARRVKEEAEQLERRRRELDEREQRLSQAAAAATERPATTELPATADAQKALVRQYHDAMLDGDVDKAGELLIQINAASATTAVNPDEIASRAVQRAKEELTADQRKKKAEEFEADRLAAVADFKTNHKDLASNPDAFGLVDSKTVEVHREHPDWSAKAIIDEAANRVRSLIKSVATPSTTDEKLEAKRNRTQVNGGSARVVNRPAPKPQSNSDYVAALRKQRGLDV